MEYSTDRLIDELTQKVDLEILGWLISKYNSGVITLEMFAADIEEAAAFAFFTD